MIVKLTLADQCTVGQYLRRAFGVILVSFEPGSRLKTRYSMSLDARRRVQDMLLFGGQDRS